MCSTPFGITDYCANLRRRLCGAALCAQRLSASQIIAQSSSSATDSSNSPCSTPFGITDYCAFACSVEVTPSWVCSTPFGITDYCAHRQRGAASRKQVLNAFRHHRLLRAPTQLMKSEFLMCSTPFGITDYCATTLECALQISNRCSTPFGITDYCAHERNDDRPQELKVLNAFRHHRLLRGGILSFAVVPTVCSTPFGITDYCAEKLH